MKMARFAAMLLAVMMLICTVATGALAEDTIKVGIVGCHTGDYAQYGLAVRNGAELYFNQLNANGGINGKQVELIIYDNRADNAEAVNAFTRMVDEGITALVGDVLTGNCMAVVLEAEPINMPMITPSATAKMITYDEEEDYVYKNVFRTCFIDPFQGEKMAQYAVEILGASTAAILYDTGNDYSIGLMDAFIAKGESLGLNIVAKEGYSTGDVDFKSQLTNIASANPDVVFTPIYYSEGGLVISQARALGITATFLAGDGFANISNYATAEELEGTVYCSAYAEHSSDAIIAFEDAYIAAYGPDTLNMFAANAYDAAIVLCNALAVAEETGYEPASEEYKQAVIDAIRDNSADLDTITSYGYTFDEYNNPIKNAVMIILKDGKEVLDRIF